MGKQKNFDKAIESFKELEKKEKHNLASSANNNLSFMYFLQGDYNNALKYADEALKAERWNANAIVNKANCLFQRKKYEDAKKQYIVAVQAEGDCHNAIYNPIEAARVYKRLMGACRNDPGILAKL